MKTKRNTFIFLFALCVVLMVTCTVSASNIYGRLQGVDRYETAVAISKSGWPVSSENAVLAYGEDFPDALCAAPLASILRAPILLTEKYVLDIRTEAELKRLGVKNVYIVGGAGVVSPNIENQLTKNGINCKRLAGQDRYETSIRIAEYVQGLVQQTGEIFVVNGEDYPDAVSVSPIAAKMGVPIILTYPKNIQAYDEYIKNFIKDFAANKAYIIGGSEIVRDSVAALFLQKQRISGEDKYQRNMAVINTFANNIDFSTAYFATGEAFPDALSGSVLAASPSSKSKTSPIILVGNSLSSEVKNLLKSKISQSIKITALGGPGAIADSILQEILYASNKIKVISISDISKSVYQDESYSLPANVNASMDDNTTMNVPVVWKPMAADTSTVGKYTFEGTVQGYDKKVLLTLEVKPFNREIPDTGRQMQQIREKWNAYKPTFEGNPYLEVPNINAPYKTGKLKPAFIDDGVKMANFIRYLAGLPDDLTADEELSNQAQYGAVLLSAVDRLDHAPDKPIDMDDDFYNKGYKSTSSSNLSYYYSASYDKSIFNMVIKPRDEISLASSVKGYMEDGDDSNVTRVGHRRWILSPALKKVGFGFASINSEKDAWYQITRYSPMQVFDKSRTEKVDYNYITWPSSGYFPVDLFYGEDPWSISLNPDKYQKPELSEVRVELSRQSDNKTWILDKADNQIFRDNEYFNVNNDGYGIPYCIIFRPNLVGSYNSGEIYNVTITGVKDITGKSVAIKYSVQYFNM